MPENPRIEELRRRVQADPASIAFAALAEEFRRVGRYDEAIETCRTGLQRHPAYLSARVTLGRALIETGDFDGAREELETVLRSAPENLAAIRGLAHIHERLGYSSAMDPHLADMMATMHAESIRVAAERPEPPPVPPPTVLQPLPEPTPVPPLAALEALPEPTPVPPPAALEALPEPTPVPPLAALEALPELPPVPSPAALEPLPEPEPFPAPEVQPDLSLAPQLEADLAPSDDAARGAPLDDAWATLEISMPEPAARVEAPLDPFAAFAPMSKPEPVHLLFVEAVPEPPIDAATVAPPEPEIEPDTEPDPEVLATLARLERFLGTIQSLRG